MNYIWQELHISNKTLTVLPDLRHDVALALPQFIERLQQNGVSGSLKHWPGIGASTGNPAYVLPSINFAAFAGLLYQNPGMIMVTAVLVCWCRRMTHTRQRTSRLRW